VENLEATDGLHSEYWKSQRDKLFVASCVALIVTAMSFAIRGNIITEWGKQFGLGEDKLGVINGAWGITFALATVVGGWLCDVLGMGKILTFAFVGHAAGIAITCAANKDNAYTMLLGGTLVMGLANGFVEAACNPLITTLYPDQKIKRLNLFHAWFPGGIVIGGLVGYFIAGSKAGGDHNWQVQMLSMLVPLFIYGFLFMGKKFPATERQASGVSNSEMFKACLNPLFIVMLVCMTMSAATELVTGGWIPDILTVTTGFAGIILLVIQNGLMAVGRNFAGPIVHRISPIAMLVGSATFASIGMFLLKTANSASTALLATVVFAVGVCFFWPTMLGVTSERFPKTGALGIGMMGGIGSMSVSIWNPIVGAKYADVKNAAMHSGVAEAAAKAQGGQAALGILAILPIVLLCVFVAMFFADKAKGGYKQEVLVQHQKEDA
jgi:fucose permease